MTTFATSKASPFKLGNQLDLIGWQPHSHCPQHWFLPIPPNEFRFTNYYLLVTSLLLASLTACTSPTLTPRPTPALVRVAVTDITQPLLLDLAAAYATVNPDVVVAPSLAPQPGLAAQLAAGQADLALTTAPDPKLFATPVGYVP